MTFSEYLYRMEARRLSNIDQEYRWHRKAWVNASARGYIGKKGARFKDFFDYEKQLDNANNTTNKNIEARHKRAARVIADANRKMGR